MESKEQVPCFGAWREKQNQAGKQSPSAGEFDHQFQRESPSVRQQVGGVLCDNVERNCLLGPSGGGWTTPAPPAPPDGGIDQAFGGTLRFCMHRGGTVSDSMSFTFRELFISSSYGSFSSVVILARTFSKIKKKC